MYIVIFILFLILQIFFAAEDGLLRLPYAHVQIPRHGVPPLRSFLLAEAVCRVSCKQNR